MRAYPFSPEEQVRPAAFLRPGSVDAATLLVLRVVRRAVWPIITIGAAVAWVNGEFNAESIERLTSPAQFFALVLSPLALLALGWALRILVNLTGLALAAPLAQGAWVAGTEATSRGRRLIDLAYLSAGYRSVRWSYAVQHEAVRRCGVLGRQLALLETVGRILLPVAIAAFVWLVFQDVRSAGA
ncbi:hypothetical protein [Isoptericola aurantiacus]|uniref:hypothetical protein n=1 Tax=Isoptericola aurantiacus TaxID=3377839 RepID=UPI00383BA482